MNREEVQLYLKLIREELNELDEALADQDLVKTLDAAVDLQVVLDGFFLQSGMERYRTAAFLEVYRSNMSKLGEDGKPIRRDDGKILKGPNYSPPNLATVITSQDCFHREGITKKPEYDREIGAPFEQ